MKNKLFSLCLIVFLGLFTFLNSCFADGTATVNGVSVVTIDNDSLYGMNATVLNAYEIGTSGVYIYNGSGGTSSTAGSLIVQGYEFKSASINITNTAADTITVRPESQVGTTTYWVNGSVTTFIGTKTGLLTFNDPATNLRWGFIKNGTNTARVTFVAEYFRYKRR